MRVHAVRSFAGVALCAAALVLVGCSPAEEPVPEPSVEPTASESPSAAPEPTDEPIVLTLPDSCHELVSLSTIQSQFGADFIPIDIDPMHPMRVDFTERGGLACVWGIPQSDAGVFLGVAEADQSDADQVAEWQAAGYTMGPDFLDETWVLNEDTELGPQVTVGVLVEGYEISVSTSGTGVDGLLTVVRNATDNMGYL